jgi:anti-sigma regulatory factor (Ser/Thr protein kinase)
VRIQTPRAPEAITFERDYRGIIDQARHVRADLAKVAADCPVSDDLVLLASELSTNAILHSRSGHPCRTFTVRVTLYPGDYAWVEVIDQGGTWTVDEYDDEHGRGLAIVAVVAGDGNWGIDGDAACRVAWFRLNWHPNAEDRDLSTTGDGNWGIDGATRGNVGPVSRVR